MIETVSNFNIGIETMVKRRFLAAIGDANDPSTWSGIPYYFLQSGKKVCLLDEGLALPVNGIAWQFRRWKWNAFRMFVGDRYGGYQYSVPFLNRLWAPYRDAIRWSIVLNCFQLYPPFVVLDPSIEKWYFIDQTLLQLFNHYSLGPKVGRRIAREAIMREKDGYHKAAGIIVFSRWAAESVTNDYEVPSEQVHVVRPGANLDLYAYETWERAKKKSRSAVISALGENRPVQFVFVGKEWKRKGLDRLIQAFSLARRQGAMAVLRVIGCQRESLPNELRNVPGVEWSGFIDKRKDVDIFIKKVSECDVGCLLSRADAAPIALREFQALGLAVLGTTAGGAYESVCLEAGWLVTPQDSHETIARMIIDVCEDKEKLEMAKNAAWNSRRSFLYDETVRQIFDVMKEKYRACS